MALYCYANGWNAEGEPNFVCSKCGPEIKRAFGCGYDPDLSGKTRVKQSPDYDLHGICPGWWRQQPYVLDTVDLAHWRANLGHPNLFPNRLFESISWLDYHTNKAEIALMEIRRRQAESKNVPKR